MLFIIWLALWVGKMNQTARCDWLPERARWSHLARSGLPTVSRKKNFPESHVMNPLLTKFVRSRWLDISLVLFLRVHWPQLRLRSINTQKKILVNIQPSWPHTWSAITHTCCASSVGYALFCVMLSCVSSHVLCCALLYYVVLKDGLILLHNQGPPWRRTLGR